MSLRLIISTILISSSLMAFPDTKANSQATPQLSFSFADRYYIYSVLKDVFGESSHHVLRDNILKNGNVFGGPCDIYEQIRIEPEKYINSELTRCFNGKHEYAYPMRVPPSLLREAWMLKACNQLVANKKWRLNALNKINAKEFESLNYLNEVQSLFDPNYEVNDEFNQKLIQSLKKMKNREQKEKFILFQNCLYPAWQVI